MTAETVLTALAAIRAPQTQDEYDLHGLTAEALQNADIEFRHEAPLAPRCRIDFLCGSVGIEIKRGRPDRIPVEKQLRRYAETGKLSAVILLSEKTLPSLPGFIAGIPIYPVSLYKLWGIATEVGAEDVQDEAKEPDISEVLPETLPESESISFDDQETASFSDGLPEDNSQSHIPDPVEQDVTSPPRSTLHTLSAWRTRSSAIFPRRTFPLSYGTGSPPPTITAPFPTTPGANAGPSKETLR